MLAAICWCGAVVFSLERPKSLMRVLPSAVLAMGGTGVCLLATGPVKGRALGVMGAEDCTALLGTVLAGCAIVVDLPAGAEILDREGSGIAE
jgi:hypothetical protein